MADRSPGSSGRGKAQRKKSNDPFSVLHVFDRLEVGPVKVEPRRLRMPYQLVQGNQSDTFELVYRYEEEVFQRGNDLSENLASMIGAQVAINYGLFGKTIVFHGSYDATDQRFIRDMAENTAREIYVNKFLKTNPFLTGDAARLSARTASTYLRAALEFRDPPSAPTQRWQPWITRTNRHALLSSGGKDSLLTYGLITETGGEAHPIFLNESGRHWFTALNAYHHMKKNVPNTARVWVNSDRLFPWMLRHMPFIRKDFARVRADDYPIRLWTVAVFLFGALPLLHKRGIGRILIGNEFDTTRRITHEGITHYDGLYDQSRYFDDALSRYYMRKGWSISQFSILRPLSELLIEKILIERYPHLHEQQVSCHATHKEGDRVRPCGQCEKCRRIVAIHTVLDADPRVCGYTDEQIARCLKAVAEKGVHQAAADAQHLAFLLREKGLLETPAGKSTRVKPRPEVMQLRFDAKRSPLDGIPVNLRLPLCRIYEEHAQGAVEKDGVAWKKVDPIQHGSQARPYAFELKRNHHRAEAQKGNRARRQGVYLWGELTWPEAKKRLTKVDIALLPVGSTEQHGPHLPLDTDIFDADYLARRVAEACSRPQPLVLPPIPYGVSYHHEEFPGTLSIRNETLSRLVYEIGIGAARNGITKLVIINGHGGNTPALNNAAQMINQDSHIFVCVDTGETSDVDIEKITETPNDVHAGEAETSTALAIRPELVRMDQAVKLIPRFSNRYLDFTSKRGVAWYAYTKKLSESGVMGDPTR
ncbi:MAG: creatininase family protein, partial [bacterium]|nr:creatininase family protein [bacterium]